VLILAQQCVCLFSAICYHRHATLLTLQWHVCNTQVDKPWFTALQYIYIYIYIYISNISYIGHLLFKTNTNDTRMLINYTWRHCKTLCSRILSRAHAHTVGKSVNSISYSSVNCHNVFLGNSAFLGVKYIFSNNFQNHKQLQIPANNDRITTLIQRHILVFSSI